MGIEDISDIVKCVDKSLQRRAKLITRIRMLENKLYKKEKTSGKEVYTKRSR
jgi:hypothetical protein